MQPELGGGSFSEAAMLPPMRAGEHIVWCGRPTTLWTLQPSDIFALVCGIPWLLFVPAIWWQGFAGSIPGPFVAFWLVGIVMCFGGLATCRLSWRKVRYFLTNERAWIIGGSIRLPVRQLELEECGVEVRGLRPDGTGTVFFFGPVMPLGVQAFRPAAYTDYRYRFDFVAIPDVQHVYDLAYRPVAPDLR